MTNRREELTQASCVQCGEIVGIHGEITMTHVLKAFKMGAKWADEHPCPESRVKIKFMDTELTMTIQQLIDYFIEQECVNVAEECNF